MRRRLVKFLAYLTDKYLKGFEGLVVYTGIFKKYLAGDTIAHRMLRVFLATSLLVGLASAGLLYYTVQSFHSISTTRSAYRQMIVELQKARLAEVKLSAIEQAPRASRARKVAQLQGEAPEQLMTVIHEATAEMRKRLKEAERNKTSNVYDISEARDYLTRYESGIQEKLKGPRYELKDSKEIETFETFLKDQIDNESQKIEELQKKLVWLVSASLLVSVLLGCIIFYHLSKSISSPIRYLTDITKRIGRGDLDFEIDTKYKGEVGFLAVSIKQMAKQLSETTTRKEFLTQMTEALAESQKIARVGSFNYTFATNRIWWSDVMFDLTGTVRGEFTPTNEIFPSFILEEDRSHFLSVASDAISQKKSSFQVEYRLQSKDGTIREMIHRSRISYDANGAPVESHGTIQDITEWKAMQREVTEREQRLQFALDAGEMGTWDAHLAEGKSYWSIRQKQLFDLPIDAPFITQEMFDSRLHPEDKERFDKVLASVLLDKGQGEIEYRVIHQDGSVHWIHGVGHVIRSKDGNPERVIGICRDITARKNAEDILKASEERLQLALKASQMGTWDYSFATKTALLSEQAMRIIGTNESNCSLDNFVERTHPEDRERFIGEFDRAVRERTPFSLEFRILVDNQIRWIYEAAHVVFDEKDKPMRVVGVLQDITQSKIAVTELKESQERLALALSAGKMGTWSWEPSTNKVIWSNDKREIFGFGDSPEDINLFIKTIHPDDLPRVNAELQHVIQSHTPWVSEFRILKNGEIRWVMESGHPMTGKDGKIDRIIGVSMDITERKDQQNLMIHTAKLAALGEMAASIAHEINNPLATIQIQADMIKNFAKRGESALPVVVEKASKISATATQIVDVVRNLKSYSRDGSKDPMSEVRIKDILDQTLSLVSEKMIEHQIQLSVDMLNANTVLECRSVQISQVLLNLINNSFDAIKDLDEKWIKVEIRNDADNVHIIVTDSGGGIPSEDQSKLFQPFHTTKEQGFGTGLGLSISHKLISEHKGVIKYNPNFSHTQFQITLPIVQAKLKANKVA